MPAKPQQQTLSIRITDSLRRRLERARQLTASKTGEPVSTSEIAKQFLESARDDRLEVADLLADATGSLVHIRRKGQAGASLSQAEWTALAHFIRHGMEASSAQAPNPVSRESVVALLDAFLAAYAIDAAQDSRLGAYFLSNVPPECRPPAKKRGEGVTPETVRRAMEELRHRVSDPETAWVPTLVGRSLYVLLDEGKLTGAEDLNRSLRPFWPVVWRLAARGHYVLTGQPVREGTAKPAGLFEPAIPSLDEHGFVLSFARGAGREFSLLLSLPGPRAARYPVVGFPQVAEFRAMLAEVAADPAPADWSGAYFFADVIPADAGRETEVQFRAHDNGITFTFSLEEWNAVDALFRRAWQMPEIRRAWEALTMEYGEL
jgi:hypothetical protein